MDNNTKKEEARNSTIFTIVFGLVFLVLGITFYYSVYAFIGGTTCHALFAFIVLCIWFIPATIATILVYWKTRNLIQNEKATKALKILGYGTVILYLLGVAIIVLLAMGFEDTILRVLYFREPVSCIDW